MGRRDGELRRDEALAHARMIVSATDLPVSADLERGFGDRPDTVAETIRFAVEVGLVGCTIEDTTGNQDRPITILTLLWKELLPPPRQQLPTPWLQRTSTCVTVPQCWSARLKRKAGS
jgi:Phosphoenolpyruvate phosphomutase